MRPLNNPNAMSESTVSINHSFVHPEEQDGQAIVNSKQDIKSGLENTKADLEVKDDAGEKTDQNGESRRSDAR